MAFFTPYGIHTEIRLSATPARGPPAALESLAIAHGGMACRLSAAWLRRLRPSLAAKPHKGSACAGLSRQQRATLVDHWQAYGLHTRALSALLPPLVASLVNSGLHPRAAGASIGSFRCLGAKRPRFSVRSETDSEVGGGFSEVGGG